MKACRAQQEARRVPVPTRTFLWRVLFAFDPRQQVMLVVAGSKSRTPKKRFYHEPIRVADARFESLLKGLTRFKGDR